MLQNLSEFKDTPDVPLELSINEGFAYVRDDHGILRIFDLANPTSITEVGVYDPPGQILSDGKFMEIPSLGCED